MEAVQRTVLKEMDLSSICTFFVCWLSYHIKIGMHSILTFLSRWVLLGYGGYYNCCVTLYYCTIEDKHHNKLFLKDGYFMYNWSVTVSFVPTVFQRVLKKLDQLYRI